MTAIRTGDGELTKNQYRREWRGGGVAQHDDPITITDERQRLIVALVQKKVSELLGSERFNASFQIGMLASFESFLETTCLSVRTTSILRSTTWIRPRTRRSATASTFET